MADIRSNDAAQTAPIAETANRPGQGAFKKALTRSLQIFQGKRFQSTLEVSQPAAPAAEPKKSLWGRFTGFVGGIRDSVVNTFTGAASTVKERGLLGALGQWAGQAWDGVKSIGAGLVEGVKSAFSSVFGAISKAFAAFTAHQREVEKKSEEQRQEEEKRQEKRYLAKADEGKRLEDAALRARSAAKAQQFQAQQGLIDKITETGKDIQIDNAALERQRERERAQKA